MTSSRFSPAYASVTLFMFLTLIHPLVGRDAFVGMAGVTLIAFIYLSLTKQPH